MEKEKIIKNFQDEILEAQESIDTIINAAANNPFGASVDLLEEKKAAESKIESRIKTLIWMEHRIRVLQSVISEIKGM